MKNLTRRLLCAAMLAASASSFAADPFPTRPLRILVPFPAGGLIDTTTRFVAQKMSEALGQPVVVENRTGADGLIAIRAVKAAPADGYTLLSVSTVFQQAPAFKLDPGYEARDFAGIGGMNEAPMVVVGASSQPDTTLAQLLARARANPNTVSFASGGVGTSSWMPSALLMNQTGAKLLHVPYKGIMAAQADVLSGRVNIISDVPATVVQNIRDGRLRAFGVATTARIAALPDVPTLTEQGVPIVYSALQGLLAPAGTPPEVVRKLSDTLHAITTSEEFRQRNQRDFALPAPMTGEQYMERLRQDTARNIKLAADLGIEKQ